MRLRRGKFNNLKSDGFDSKKEAAFAQKLELLRSAACDSQRVVSVEKQVPFVLSVAAVNRQLCSLTTEQLITKEVQDLLLNQLLTTALPLSI